MDSSLVLQLQQAFLHSKMSDQPLSPPEINPFSSVLFEDESYVQLSPDFGPDSPQLDIDSSMQENVEFHHEISEEMMNSTAYQEDDADIPVDPVLGYISDMLMDEDMEDRRCMFVDSSAYRAMADELAGLLGPSSASSELHLASEYTFLVGDISCPSSLEDCPSVASLDKEEESCEGLYDEILKDAMTSKDIADFLESDFPASREYPRLENDSSENRDYSKEAFLRGHEYQNRLSDSLKETFSSDYPLREHVSFEQNRLSDNWIKQVRTESVERSGQPQANRSSSVAALGQLPVCAPETSWKASVNSCSSSIWKANSLPSSTSEPIDANGYGLPKVAKPLYPANGREELFRLLQRSVASHVGKGKQKESEGRYSSLGGRRLQESKSFQESTGSRHSGKLQRTSSGRYLQESSGLSSDRDGDSLGFEYSSGVRSLRRSSPSHIIQLWAVGEPIEDEEDAPHAADQYEGAAESSDMLSLLIRCAQAVAGNNIRKANEIVREIREEATPFGDGKQRLAFYFMEALVARISGTGGCLYTALNNRRYSAAEMLKAYQLRIEKCPFIRISHFFSNQTIANACDGESRLHVVDYGILYGFQWPSLIQTLANRPGGPPRLRITGIDFPQPGIKPSERVEDTGRRLSEFARSCGVPFEYHALAVTKWEDIQPSSLFLRHDEVLAVNCMFRLRHLLDETVMAESPRKKVLARIKSIQPKVFVEAEVNAGYNAPFSFMARFQEALAHFDNVYDAIDSCVTRDHPDRRLLEQEIFGREILNVVACEGLERVERAEQYKHWQWRTQKAGFEMLPLDRNTCNKAKQLMHQYHKDYSLAEEGGWLMVGWRGRFSRCISAWKPAL